MACAVHAIGRAGEPSADALVDQSCGDFDSFTVKSFQEQRWLTPVTTLPRILVARLRMFRASAAETEATDFCSTTTSSLNTAKTRDGDTFTDSVGFEGRYADG